LLFDIKEFSLAEVPPGYVAVIRSNVGLQLETKTLDKNIEEIDEVEQLLVIDKNTRGICKEPVAPGKYNLNEIAFTAFMVPTSAVTIDWGKEVSDIGNQKIIGLKNEESSKTDKFNFNPLRVTSKDGFQLDVSVRLVIRIKPEHASFLIARFGSVANLIEQIAHPLIDSSFRNSAGSQKAIEFVQNRTVLQKTAHDRAVEEFKKFKIEVQNLLIAYIDVDKALLETQTKKELAEQRKAQYTSESDANEKQIKVKENEARANKQKEVIDAELGITIAENNAKAKANEGDGIMQYTKKIAEGEAYKVSVEGSAQAEAYQKQSDAIGKDNLYLMNVAKELKGQKLVPETLIVSGGDAGQLTNIAGVFMKKMLDVQK
jgi:regulator of protease activity HflC (stomatin/prohibitin superfamily)